MELKEFVSEEGEAIGVYISDIFDISLNGNNCRRMCGV